MLCRATRSLLNLSSRRGITCGGGGFSCTKMEEKSAAPSSASPATTTDSLKCHDFFGVHRLFTVSDLFHARVHLGHTARALDPRMRGYLYGQRFGAAIFDLDQTARLLREALNFTAHVAAAGGIVLFVAKQPQLVHLVERTAVECGEYAHCRQWSPDIFCAPRATFGGEVRLPDLLILLHTKDGLKYNDHGAIEDAAKALIPTVAIVDSDCNPNLVTFPVPGNDDTIESIQLYLHLFKQAVLLGKKHKEKEEGLSTS